MAELSQCYLAIAMNVQVPHRGDYQDLNRLPQNMEVIAKIVNPTSTIAELRMLFHSW